MKRKRGSMDVAYKVVTVVAAVGAVLLLGFFLLLELGFLE